MSTITTVRSADVELTDLDALEEMVNELFTLDPTDTSPPSPLAAFLTHLIDELRAGKDVTLMTTPPAASYVLRA